MANQPFQRSPKKGAFGYAGINIGQPPDEQPQGRCPALLNVEVDLPRGVVQSRPGLKALCAPTGSPAHSVIRLNDPAFGSDPGSTAEVLPPDSTGENYLFIFGAGSSLYAVLPGAVLAAATQIDTGYSGNPLSLIPFRPNMSPRPWLYVFDSLKQVKVRSDGQVQGVGVWPPQTPPATALAQPNLNPVADITDATGWTGAGAAGAVSLVNRVAASTTIQQIAYDAGNTGWCSIHPSGTSFSYIPTLRPVVLMNGWGNNAHVGPYEMGVDQATSWGLNNDTTYPYSNSNNVADANSSTYANSTKQHTHQYSGCIWGFADYPGGAATSLTLNILSEIPADGTNGLVVNNRSAGVWYSVDAGATWTKVYEAGSGVTPGSFAGRAKGWDAVPLPANTDPRNVQVMAFSDSHDDMVHYVYEVNLAASGHNAAFSFGARLLLNGTEMVTVAQMFAGFPDTTVAGILYDNAGDTLYSGSGLATVQATAPIKLARNMMVVVNGNVTRVLSVTEGPDGLSSFRCILPSGVTPGNALIIPTSFRCYTTGTHATGEAITSQLINAAFAPNNASTQATVAPAASFGTTGLVSKTIGLDLSQINNRPLTDDDYMHVSLRFDNPQNVSEVHILLDVDTQTNDFTGNYYYKIIQQNDFQNISTASITTRDALLNAVTDGVIGELGLKTPGVPNPDELPVGAGQFLEATFRLQDLTRAGTDPAASLAAVKAIGIRVIISGPVALQFNSWWVQGTYGPDANWNSNGNQGQEILYRYRYRSSNTGAISNPSPATRSGELPIRGGVNVTVAASTDPQVDLIDIERNGGTFDTWHQCLTVPNQSGDVLDSIRETVAMAGDPLPTDIFPPWPVTDMPRVWTGLTFACRIVGTRIYIVNAAASGFTFNTNWARGTAVIINGQTYSLYSSPDSQATAQVSENIGVLDNAKITIPEATIMGVPLPCVCGPFDGRMFGVGDKFNPGLLYFTQPGNPDAASDSGWIEVTTPSEPLLSCVVYEGSVWVFSNTSLYRVEPTPGQANPYAAYKIGSTPSGPLLPWLVAAGTNLAWLTHEGVMLYGGGGVPEDITDADLAPLFRGGIVSTGPGLNALGNASGTVLSLLAGNGAGGTQQGFVQANSAYTNGLSLNIPFTAPNTAGNSILVDAWFTGDVPVTISDTARNQNWTLINSVTNPNGQVLKQWLVVNVRGGANTVKLSFPGVLGAAAAIYEYAGVVSTLPVDAAASSAVTAASGTLTLPESVNTTQAGDILHLAAGAIGPNGVAATVVSATITVLSSFTNNSTAYTYGTVTSAPAAAGIAGTPYSTLSPFGSVGQYQIVNNSASYPLTANSLVLNAAAISAMNANQDFTVTAFIAATSLALSQPGDYTPNPFLQIYDVYLDVTFADGATARVRPSACTVITNSPSLTGAITDAPLAYDADPATYATITRVFFNGVAAPNAFQFSGFFNNGASGQIIEAPVVIISDNGGWTARASNAGNLPVAQGGKSVVLSGYDHTAGVPGAYSDAAVLNIAANACASLIALKVNPFGGSGIGPRLSWAGRFLFLDAAVNSGFNTTLVFDTLLKGWIQHNYLANATPSVAGAAMHYLEERYWEPNQPARKSIIIGGNNGGLYQMDRTATDDAGTPFTSLVITPLDNQGDSRARKQYGELLLDYIAAAQFAAQMLYDQGAVTASWTVPVAAARAQLVHDLGVDSTALHKNIGLLLSWAGSAGVALYEWQPSWFPTPEDTWLRATDWTDCGTPSYKFVHGLRLDADTGGQSRTVQIQADGGTVVATLTVNHNGEMVKPYSFVPFKAHLVRLVPTDSNSWRLFGVEWEVDPEPEPTSYWVSQPGTFDLPGFLHVRDIEFAYATDTAGAVLNVIVDGITYPLANLPVTGGNESKLYIVAPPIKGKLWQFEAIGVNLQVYERDCVFRIKPWGGDSYQPFKALGETTRTSGGARI